jgi:hypothetical protein
MSVKADSIHISDSILSQFSQDELEQEGFLQCQTPTSTVS